MILEDIMTITHSGARTRALYKWEREDLCQRPAGKKQLGEKQLNAMAQSIWASEGWDKRAPCPQIHVAKLKELSYSIGRKHIYLVPPNPGAKHIDFQLGGTNAVVLIHELVHARGFGEGPTMHSVGFVKLYIQKLARHLGWNEAELTQAAENRGLL